ncbi:MAG: DUF3492 domain-containing protein [Chloroflexi bacterium]|nr:DUF3492 domain-containing protein [Chloroflexota bacterium]
MIADICLLVEGTYPYVTGGVSQWLHALITSLHEFTFSIVHFSAAPDPERTPRYEFPPNVVKFTELCIHTPPGAEGGGFERDEPEIDWAGIRSLHEFLAAGSDSDGVECLVKHASHASGDAAIHSYLHSKEAWDFLQERYETRAPRSSFIDFFWTYRMTHLPLFALLNASLPQARVYHAVSTGYAGLAGAFAKVRHGSPLLITEHGIYTREREIEIAQAEWIYTEPSTGLWIDPQSQVLKGWWTHMFRFMARFAYDHCDELVSLTRVNQRFQIRDGADPTRMRLIPNGIAIERFGSLRAVRRVDPGPFVVGFVGRVVPIKDVKTFLRAVSVARRAIPHIQAQIVGPTDEDPAYFEECRELVRLLDLADIVHFVGRADVLDYYPSMDALVLTSLSEGQPLVILEANCAGVPVVATDVGACRELLEGTSLEDEAIGPSGLLTAPASPDETATAIIRLAQDESLHQRLALAGQKRVREFYREESVYDTYRTLYRTHLARSSSRAEA